jgi:hypothetical protein
MQGAEMNNYKVTITFDDGAPYVWQGFAESQYRAEVLAVREMRKSINSTFIGIDTEELT